MTEVKTAVRTITPRGPSAAPSSCSSPVTGPSRSTDGTVAASTSSAPRSAASGAPRSAAAAGAVVASAAHSTAGAAGGEGVPSVGARLGSCREDRALELLQLGARLERELVDERRPRGAVRRQRVGLATASVERAHLQRAQPFAQRMLGDQRVELGGRLGRAPALEVGADPALERREPQLVEPRGDRSQRGQVREIAERRAAPERERGTQLGRGRLGAPGRVLGRAACGPLLEALQVQRTVGRDQRVAAAPGDDRLAPEQLAQLRHIPLDDVRRRLRRRLVPEAVDQPVERHDLVRVGEQKSEQRTLVPAGERDRAPVHASRRAARGSGTRRSPADTTATSRQIRT